MCVADIREEIIERLGRYWSDFLARIIKYKYYCSDNMFSGINKHLMNLDNGGYRIVYEKKFVTLK